MIAQIFDIRLREEMSSLKVVNAFLSESRKELESDAPYERDAIAL